MKKIIAFTLFALLCVCNVINIYAMDYDVSISITNEDINGELRIQEFIKSNNDLFLALASSDYLDKKLVKIDLSGNKLTVIMDKEKLGGWENKITKSQNGITLKKSNAQKIIFEEMDSNGNIVDSVSFESQGGIPIKFKGEIYYLKDNVVYKLKDKEMEQICSLKDITGLESVDYSNIFQTENTLWANAANDRDGYCKVVNILDNKVLENNVQVRRITEDADKSIVMVGEKYFPIPKYWPPEARESLILRIDTKGNDKLETIQRVDYLDLPQSYTDSDETQWTLYTADDSQSIYKKSKDSTIIRYTLSESDKNNEDINIVLNDINLQFGQKPVIINDRTLVPLRGFAACLNSEVIWNNEEKSITLKKDTDTIKLIIGESKCIFNDKIIQIDTAPEIINNKTMIPIRIVSELFGYKVEWINNTIVINK